MYFILRNMHNILIVHLYACIRVEENDIICQTFDRTGVSPFSINGSLPLQSQWFTMDDFDTPWMMMVNSPWFEVGEDDAKSDGLKKSHDKQQEALKKTSPRSMFHSLTRGWNNSL